MSDFVSDVTTILVAYNSADILPGCLAALARNGVTKIIIVDNASAEPLVPWAATHAPSAQLITNAINEGFGRAMNQGVAAAPTKWCLLINPDAQMDHSAMEAMLHAARAYPDVALFGPAIFEKGERTPIFSARSPLSYFLPNKSGKCEIPIAPASTPFISGACMLVRRADFMRLGGFDKNIFLYYEDDDLCRRFSEARLGPVYVPAAHVRHAGGKSSAAPTKAEQYRLAFTVKWHLAWSRLYVARKYGLRHARIGKILILLLRHFIGWIKSLAKPAIDRVRAAATLGGVFAFLRGQTALQRQGLE